ncbi:MAG TPA: RnfABCDGE type electron transport complex subunit D [Thermoplasmata archaeon]|nr:RnfABCDGE type electron transport complex subunit D [Thermoplasmata archaeon]
MTGRVKPGDPSFQREKRRMDLAASSSVPTTPVATSRPRRFSRIRGFLARYLPPARLTWIALLALGAYGADKLHFASGVPLLILLPLVGAGSDLLFQAIRFSSFRFPDAGIATGAFLALLLPPTAIVFEAGIVAFAAIALRHILRYRGRPWFNPAAMGVVIGAVMFGMAPAWWVALGTTGELLMLALGVVVLARSWRTWRLPVTFLIAYAALATLYHFLYGGATSLPVLALSVFDPTALFFGLYMVPEPRTAPSDPHAQPLYSAVVAVLAVFSPLIFPTLGLLIGLLAGNILSAVLRRHSAASEASADRVGSRPRGSPRVRRASARWSVTRRFAAGLFLLIFLGVAAAASVGPSSTPSLVVSAPPATGGGGGSTNAAACASDTSSVDSSTLSLLHSELGPSVILSYDANTGVVVFYDPVNQVTVTETDLYEDHGFAEFNGDDYTVSGCAP